MPLTRLLPVLLVVVLASACSREGGLTCEEPDRYEASTSVPPLRIPDDLNVPDEADVLRIPDETLGGADEADAELPCLESPPDFFDGANQG